MSYLSSSRRSEIRALITAKEAELAVARTAYLSALESGDTESYMLDTKEGRQSTTLRSPSVLRKEIEALESDINRLKRKLEGRGLVNMNLRRRY